MTVPKQEAQILKLQQEIYRRVEADGITHIEAIAEYCSDNDIEPESIISLLSGPVRAKIEREASDLNLITQKTPSLI